MTYHTITLALIALFSQAAFAQTEPKYQFRTPLKNLTVAPTTGMPTPVPSPVPAPAPAAQASLSLTSQAIQFDDTKAFSSSQKSVQLLNQGAGTATGIRNLTTSGAVFSSSTNCGSTLAPGGSCDITLIFSPTDKGATYSGTFSVLADVSNSPLTATLSGNSLTHTAAASPSTANFGSVLPGFSATSVVTFTKSGQQDVLLTSAVLQNAPASVTIDSNSCAGAALTAENSSCSVTLKFSPSAPGNLAGVSLSLTASEEFSPVVVPVTGTAAQYATSCKQLLALQPSASSGFYTIDPDGAGGAAPFQVECDMTRDGGGWTLVARILTNSYDHVNTAAVGSLSSSSQPSAAKLSDSVINQLTTTHYVLRADGQFSHYFQVVSGAPFIATGVAVGRPSSSSFNGSYRNPGSNSFHAGLNGFNNPFNLVYGAARFPDNDGGCRKGMGGPATIDGVTTGLGWCGPGGSGSMWVK